MSNAHDVVIIGGGVIGSAIAYFLSANRDFNGRVCVIERDPLYRTASSMLSTSSIRQQFATLPNIGMSQYSIGFLRDANATLAVDGESAEIGLKEPGYLFLCPPHRAADFARNHELQVSAGVSADLLQPRDLERRFGWINTDGIGLGSQGVTGEGWFDGPGLLQALRRKARHQGVEYVATSAIGLEKSPAGSITAVQLADGRRLACGVVVNAAGAWAGQVAKMAALDVPVVPHKRCVFVFQTPARFEPALFVHDTSGVFFRPEGPVFICGTTPPQENAPDDFSLDVDHGLFDELIWPALAHRVPEFEQLRLLRAWAGFYEYNIYDQSAFLGSHPEIKNFILATGFSGHGMMHSPAAGLGISELITYGKYRTLDLAPFAFERMAGNRPIKEPVY